jgi:selenocysteine lyase/cysteine desulfurase
MSTNLTSTKLGVAELAAHFDAPAGYFAAASNGILPRTAVAAMIADLQRCGRGEVAPADYDPVVAQTRASYASLVGVPAEWVAIGAVTSVLVANIAAGLPDGAEVLVGQTEFTSVVLPFLAGSRLNVRTVPLPELAAAITVQTALVAFSLVQSATGEVIPAEPILTAARRHQALTLADLTQAAGVLPVRASDFDFTVAHTYKWLCTPRGVAFLTIRPEAADRLIAVAAGWYSADDPWGNCYWPQLAPAATARRFDTAPAWQVFVGARESIGLFATADIDALWAHSSALGDQLCRGVGIPEQHRAVVSWPDPDHRQLAQLTAAGLRASGPLGLIRVAFAAWNNADDVEAALSALS